MTAKIAIDASKVTPHKKRRRAFQEVRLRAGLPLAWRVYMALALILGVLGLIIGKQGLFFAAVAFLALAELSSLRRSNELSAQRAQERMGWPPCQPPLPDGAESSDRMIAWAKIATKCAELGDWDGHRKAWAMAEAELAQLDLKR